MESTTAALVGHGEKYRQCGMQCVRDIYEYFKWVAGRSGLNDKDELRGCGAAHTVGGGVSAHWVILPARVYTTL